MYGIETILALLAHGPLVALVTPLATPHAIPQADGTNFASIKDPTNQLGAASELCPGLYSGPWSEFPEMNKWTSFDNMFNANIRSMFMAGSNQQDVHRIRIAVTSVASLYGIDARVLFGIIMQESHGGVGVVTTIDADGVTTGGLMQTSGCHGYDGQNGLAQADTTYMVDCGTQHYKKNLADWGSQNSEKSIYPALREFNSGSVVASDLSTAPNGVGNPAYVSDLAQRFLGWVN